MKKLMSALAFLPSLIAPASVPAMAQQGSAYDFTFQAIEGAALPLGSFRGKVLLVVNVASFCGYTQQYRGLQALYERYRDRGLVIIGVPSNDFGEQEPGTAAEIKTFCEGAFGVTFPLTTKEVVKGPDAHPFYRWVQAGLGDAGMPKWNFHKVLVGADGGLIQAFATRVAPDAKEIVAAIEASLAARPAG
jgi:glutathione peroxidase